MRRKRGADGQIPGAAYEELKIICDDGSESSGSRPFHLRINNFHDQKHHDICEGTSSHH
jgi:hypothetical protein